MILHITTSLDSGGAEALLTNFVKTDKLEKHVVVSLSTIGFYGPGLEAAGLTVHALNMPRSRVIPGALIELFKIIRQYDPRVIQTWMYHANFLGGILGRLAGKNCIVWGIHNSEMDPEGTSFSMRFCDRACALMSGFVPRSMVHNSVSGAELHIAKGYSRKKMKVIASGFNVNLFKPNSDVRNLKRKELGIADDQLVFGMVARFDPLKDHGNMMSAIGSLSQDVRNRSKFVFIGSGLDENNTRIQKMIIDSGLSDEVVLLGQRRDVPDLLNALDVHVLSSSGESFPNVVNEAMATGIPCIVTDVGDSSMIVGETGWVVPPRNSVALSKALENTVNLVGTEEWSTRKLRCRQRVLDNFTIDKMIANYHAIWATVS